jgi:microcystin-dependent protein
MKKSLITLLLFLAFFHYSNVAKSQDALIGELRLFPYNYIPKNWAECKGQIFSIQQNVALFSIIGTYYGGNGSSNFALPDLQGRIAMMPDNNVFGQQGGTETETMTVAQLPPHTHTINYISYPVPLTMPCSSAGEDATAPGYYAMNTSRGNEFNSTTNATSGQISTTVTSSGGTTARSNMQPYLTLVWCICTSGIFPSHN